MTSFVRYATRSQTDFVITMDKTNSKSNFSDITSQCQLDVRPMSDSNQVTWQEKTQDFIPFQILGYSGDNIISSPKACAGTTKIQSVTQRT
jgi:hypothetical protein